MQISKAYDFSNLYQSSILQLSPKSIVTTRLRTCHFCYQLLHPPPIVDVLQKWVHPPIYYTVAGVKFSLVVSVMFFRTKDQT